jgi:hypothetical protein
LIYIYRIQSKGFQVKGHEEKVYKLKRSLYGLKQLSRQQCDNGVGNMIAKTYLCSEK